MQDLSTLSGKTVLTGDRPTGKLHIGHLAGTLLSRVALQDQNDVTVLVADLQALTDNSGRAAAVADNVREVVLDYIAAGLDPEKVTIVRQSDLPALSEMTILYMNLISVPKLLRIPTIKEEIESRNFGGGTPAGFLCYPISQAADITGFDADCVPAGADQAPLIEVTCDVVRLVNRMGGSDVLRAPVQMRGSALRLPGIDGCGKMSKSASNAIALSATADELKAGVMSMFTDPGHIKVSDPGRVEGNVVFSMLDAFDPAKDEVEDLKAHYRKGGLGDMVLKRRLLGILEDVLAPMRDRRAQAESSSDLVDDILATGAARGQQRTSEQLGKVREVMSLVR
jgi:tryptophanyl-tRNA synthetase